MKQELLVVVVVFTSAVNCLGFFNDLEFDYNNMETVTPTNLEELRNALCKKVLQDQCVDTEKRTINLNMLFDFTNTEGTKTEDGCLYTSDPEKCNKMQQKGQQQLNINNECQVLKNRLTKVSYDMAGLRGLHVGSNKLIRCLENDASPSCGISGKGLRLKNVYNVKIQRLFIGNINPQIINGGIGVELSNVRNVAIEFNIFSKIGDYMVVSHEGSSQAVALNFNTFDGKTDFSASCDYNTNRMWKLNGEGDSISIEENLINNAFGPVLRIQTPNNAKSHIHLKANQFTNIATHKNGFIDLDSTTSSIFAENNCFPLNINMIYSNKGAINMPTNCYEANVCRRSLKKYVGCNTIVPAGEVLSNNQALEDQKEVENKISTTTITKDLAEKDWSYLQLEEKSKEIPIKQAVSQQVAGGQSTNQQAAGQQLASNLSDKGARVRQQLARNPSDKGPLVRQQLAHNPSDKGQLVRQQLVRNPSDKGPLVRQQLVRNPSDKGPLVSQQLARNPSDKGALVRQQLARNPSDKGALVNQQLARNPSDKGPLVSQQLATGPQSVDVKPTAAVASLDSNNLSKLENKDLNEDKKKSQTLLQRILDVLKSISEKLFKRG